MNGRFAVLLSTFSLILATVCTVFAQGFSTGELEVRVLDLDGQAMEGIDVTLIGVGKKTTPDAVWTALGEGAYQLTATRASGIPFDTTDTLVGQVAVIVEPNKKVIAQIPRNSTAFVEMTGPDGGPINQPMQFEVIAQNPNPNFAVRAKAKMRILADGQTVFSAERGPITLEADQQGYFGWEYIPRVAGEHVVAVQVLHEFGFGTNQFQPSDSTGYLRPLTVGNVFISAVSPPNPAEVHGGEPFTVDVTVKNLGQYLNRLALLPLGLPDGWTASPQEEVFALGPNQSAQKRFTIVPAVDGGTISIRWQVELRDAAPEPIPLAGFSQAITAKPAPANLAITITDPDGNAQAGIAVTPGTLPAKSTPAALWTKIEPALYPVQAVRPAEFPFTVGDTWVHAVAVDAKANRTNEFTLTRNTPYFAEIEAAAFTQSGQPWDVTLVATTPEDEPNRLAKVQFVVYQSGVLRHNVTVGPRFISAGGESYFGFQWTPAAPGDYTVGLQLQSELATGSYTPTDSMIFAPLPVVPPGHPVVTALELPAAVVRGVRLIADAIAVDSGGTQPGITSWEYIFSNGDLLTDQGTIEGPDFSLGLPTELFPADDYILSVRARDRDGNWSEYRSAVVRIVEDTEPRIVFVSTDLVAAGTADLPIILQARNTAFRPGITSVRFDGNDINVHSLEVLDDERLRMLIDVPISAQLGQRIITVRTGTEEVVLAGEFTVIAPATVLSLGLLEARPGQIIDLPLQLARGGGLTGYNLRLAFDPRSVEWLEARPGNLTPTWSTPTHLQEEGTVTLAAAGAQQVTASVGSLLILSFRVAPNLDTNTFIPIEIEQFQLNDGSMPGYASNGGILVAPPVLGDLNGDGIDGTLDSSLILQWRIGLIDHFPIAPEIIAPAFPALGDLNGDAQLGTVDASLILQKRIGLIDAYPVEQQAPARLNTHTSTRFPDASSAAVLNEERQLSLTPLLAGTPGQSLLQTLSVDDASGLLGWYAELSLPEAWIEVVAVHTGPRTPNWADPIFALQDGVLRIAASGATPASGSGGIAEIELRLLNSAPPGTVALAEITDVDLNDRQIPAQPGGYGIIRVQEIDSDGDGMPDAWENAFGLNPFDPSDANLDSDEDSTTNLEEFIADTDPINPENYLALTPLPDSTGAGLELQWQAAAGRVYQLECAPIEGSAGWTDAVEWLPEGTRNEFQRMDDDTITVPLNSSMLDSSAGQRFRLRVRW